MASKGTQTIGPPKELDENEESFLQETTVHGVRYLSQGRSWIERIAWAALLAIAFGMTIIMAVESAIEAKENPISTTLETYPREVKMISFS